MRFFLTALFFVCHTAVFSAPVEIIGVTLTRRPYARWEVILDLNHEDLGRHNFCDRIDILDQDGNRIFVGNFFEPRWKDVEEDGPLRRRLRPLLIP